MSSQWAVEAEIVRRAVYALEVCDVCFAVADCKRMGTRAIIDGRNIDYVGVFCCTNSDACMERLARSKAPVRLLGSGNELAG